MTTSRPPSHKQLTGFTLVELIVVMAVITILISVGAVGIGRMDEAQKTNSSIALVEALTNEAQRMAIGKNSYTRLCIVNDTGDLDRHLRYFAIAVFEQSTNAVTGVKEGRWVINSRGNTIPKGVYYDPTKSLINTAQIGSRTQPPANTGTPAIPQPLTTDGHPADHGVTFPGGNAHNYYYYEFNSQGICIDSSTPGATAGGGLALIGGYLSGNTLNIKGNDKVGFIIWRNGSTSKIRDISQIP